MDETTRPLEYRPGYMKYRGIEGSIEIDTSDETYCGSAQNIKSQVSYNAEHLCDIEQAFRAAADAYISKCIEEFEKFEAVRVCRNCAHWGEYGRSLGSMVCERIGTYADLDRRLRSNLQAIDSGGAFTESGVFHCGPMWSCPLHEAAPQNPEEDTRYVQVRTKHLASSDLVGHTNLCDMTRDQRDSLTPPDPKDVYDSAETVPIEGTPTTSEIDDLLIEDYINSREVGMRRD